MLTSMYEFVQQLFRMAESCLADVDRCREESAHN